jgi:hypothetical protein
MPSRRGTRLSEGSPNQASTSLPPSQFAEILTLAGWNPLTLSKTLWTFRCAVLQHVRTAGVSSFFLPRRKFFFICISLYFTFILPNLWDLEFTTQWNLEWLAWKEFCHLATMSPTLTKRFFPFLFYFPLFLVHLSPFFSPTRPTRSTHSTSALNGDKLACASLMTKPLGLSPIPHRWPQTSGILLKGPHVCSPGWNS